MNTDIEKKAFRKWVILVSGIAAACFLVYLLQLFMMLRRQTRSLQDQDNERFFASTISNLDSNIREINSLTETFNENNNIMLNNLLIGMSGDKFQDIGGMTAESQSEMLLHATSTMPDCVFLDVVGSKGTVFASSNPEDVGLNIINDTDYGLTPESFRKLNGKETDNLVVANPLHEADDTAGKQLYLYSCEIPGALYEGEALSIMMAVSSDIIDTAVDRLSDLSNWLNASTIGNNGAVFMVDPEKDIIKYGTLLGIDETGKSASAVGFSPEVLQDGYTGNAVIDGISCYVSVRAHSSDLYGLNQYIVAAIPLSDLYSVNVSVVVWNACLFLVFVILVIAYSSFVRSEAFKKGEDLKKVRLFSRKGRDVYLSRTLAGRILPVILFSSFLMFLCAFYFQTLMRLSDAFSESVSVEAEISRNVEESAKLQEDFLSYYNYQYESQARLMAFIVTYNGEKYFDYEAGDTGTYTIGNIDEDGNRHVMQDAYGNTVCCISNSRPLEELKKANHVENIYLISDSGNTMATSSSYWNFSLSQNPEDQSFAFWDILDGKQETIVQDAMISDEGKYSQYVGCYMHYYTCLDEYGHTKFVSHPDYLKQLNGTWDGSEITLHRGLIQFEVNPKEAHTVMDSAKPEYILANTKISNNGFLIGFEYKPEADDYCVFYSPITSMTDKSASELGLSRKAFSGNYNGFQTMDGVRYLQSFRQVGEYFIATAIAMGSLYANSLATSFFCALFAMAAMFILTSRVIFVGDTYGAEPNRQREDPMAVLEHWQPAGRWKDRSPSQKFEMIIKNSLIFLGIVFLAAILLEAVKFKNNSAILYIIGGEWDRGVHIFSLSACIVIIIISALVIRVLGHIAYLIASAFDSRMVTMMRLFVALFKAAAVVIVIFFCLYLMGIDATKLLASAGIMSVVVGLGAQSLVGDLLAGIFIVMEGAVHVGDYILIDNIRGKVMDIGLRTTRYEDDHQNIRIVCNNEIKAFANMSMKYSVVLFNIPVPYGEDFLRIRKILNEEFLKLYEEHSFLKSIPVCQGIENFSDSSVDLRVKFICEESHRYDVQRFMRDEIMRIFTENGIQIPFNQLDVHLDR